MDLTFQTEYDEDRSVRVIGRAWAVRTRGATILSWCMGIAGLIWLFGHVMDVNPKGDLFWCIFLLFYPLFAWFWRWLFVRWCRKALRTQMGGAKAVNLHLTHDFYECSFGESLSRIPWRTLATSYLFMNDAVVLFLHKSPRLVLDEADLRAGNVNRAEFEAALRNAGMKSIYELWTRKVEIILEWIFGLLIILWAVPRVCSSISNRVLDIRTTQVQARLFREVHGATTNCPYVVEASWPSRLVSSFLKTTEPDECLYIFDDEEEEYKVGIFARYGARSYEAYFPCGCACEQLSGSFDHIKELHKPTVFLEAEKEKWLEKVRPIAKDLYESEDEDENDGDENGPTPFVDAKTEEELCGHSPVTDEERKLLRRMREMRLPQISFRPPATLKDAVDFLIMASHPVGEPEAMIEIVIQPAQSGTASPLLPVISGSDISFYETAKLVSECVGYKMEIRGNKIYFREMTGCELAPK